MHKYVKSLKEITEKNLNEQRPLNNNNNPFNKTNLISQKSVSPNSCDDTNMHF